MTISYLFGPVASRRLGISLGIDLVPRKTCSLNCVYCESGATTRLTTERREYAPPEEIIRQLDERLRDKPSLDYLTFSGAGEPMLNSGIGRIVEFVKREYPRYRTCLLTNGTLLHDPAAVRDIAEIDLVVPSLDASSREEFDAINRPAPGIDFDVFTKALVDYCRTTKSEVWLEIFIVPGVNDSDAAIARFAGLVKAAAPAKVQLNTLDRPGCVDWIRPSTQENTMRFVRALEPLAPVEAVGPFKYQSGNVADTNQASRSDDLGERIVALVTRRPSTTQDIAAAFGIGEERVRIRLRELLQRGSVRAETRERGEFFAGNQP